MSQRDCPSCGLPNKTAYVFCGNCNQYNPEHSDEWAVGDFYALAFYVYILELNDGSYYTGQTRSLRRRLDQHRNNQVLTTAHRDPQLVWYNTVDTREQAVHLELQLNHTKHRVKSDMIRNFNNAIKSVTSNTHHREDIELLRNEQMTMIESNRSVTRTVIQTKDSVEQMAEALHALAGNSPKAKTSFVWFSTGLFVGLALALWIFVNFVNR